jgi:hypothetical protein
MEPTATRRGIDSHRTTVEHNFRAGEGTVQTDHRRVRSKRMSGNPLEPQKYQRSVRVRKKTMSWGGQPLLNTDMSEI